jgi:hypothetical protein
MKRSELSELQYIAPIANLASIMHHGLLSNRRAQAHKPVSVALGEVQALRAKKQVPGGRPLHEYVNLYFCARNPMLYKRLGQRHEVCVLSVSPDVLDFAGVVVTDINAASGYARFGGGAKGLVIVDKDLTYAERWTDSDPISFYRKSGAKCAEVLVPDTVPPALIKRAYVCSAAVTEKITKIGVKIPVAVNEQLFFNRA